jgi:hypothetical protein
MHKEVLNKSQLDLLPFLKNFKDDFGLVGGTAIALHIGHRFSIDFDLFTNKQFSNSKIEKVILKEKKIDQVLIDEKDELTIIIDGVKLTFLYYPFKIEFKENLDEYIKMADLLTLASLKAYALGRRAKWKDYVDLYFIMENNYSIDDIINRSREIFSDIFSEKNFITQLAYFDDIDFSEFLDFKEGFEINEEEVKKKLIDLSIKKGP